MNSRATGDHPSPTVPLPHVGEGSALAADQDLPVLPNYSEPGKGDAKNSKFAKFAWFVLLYNLAAVAWGVFVEIV